MTGLKNIDRSLKRMARKHAREAQRALKNLSSNKTVMADICLRKQVEQSVGHVDWLITMIKEKCRKCGKRIPFGCTQCAGCADEEGP